MDIGAVEALRHWDTLSDAERDRLKEAVRMYNEVQAHNLGEEWSQQSDGEREEAARPVRWREMTLDEQQTWREGYLASPKAVWMEKMSSLAQLMSGGLGGKSSLLDRLVRGELPLKQRPPTSFSYPWYSLVEGSTEEVASTVSLGGVMSLGSAMRGAGGEEAGRSGKLGRLVINQTVFVVVEANEAGDALLNRAKELLETPDGIREVDDWSAGAGRAKKRVPVVTRAHQGWDAVIEAYRCGPEIEVKHGSWPSWKLHLGRRGGCADARWANEAVGSPPFSQIKDLDPLDLLFANLDARIVAQVESDEIQEDSVDEAVRRIRNVLDGMPADYSRGDPVEVVSGQNAVHGGTSYLESSCWVLSKTEAWRELSREGLYVKL